MVDEGSEAERCIVGGGLKVDGMHDDHLTAQLVRHPQGPTQRLTREQGADPLVLPILATASRGTGIRAGDAGAVGSNANAVVSRRHRATGGAAPAKCQCGFKRSLVDEDVVAERYVWRHVLRAVHFTLDGINANHAQGSVVVENDDPLAHPRSDGATRR